jgi:hypothetical protein
MFGGRSLLRRKWQSYWCWFSQLLNPNLLGRPSEAEAVQLLGSKEAFQKERVIGQLEIDRILTPSIRRNPSIATMTGTC